MKQKMELEIDKMSLADFEQIQEKLQTDFDDFWTPFTLKEELENKNRFRLSLHSSKTEARNCRICRNYQNTRRN